jgi:hypothetical protein
MVQPSTQQVISDPHCREKNWALAVVHDSLIFLHQLAPCLVWLRYAPAAPKGLELFQMTCLSDEVAACLLLRAQLPAGCSLGSITRWLVSHVWRTACR